MRSEVLEEHQISPNKIVIVYTDAVAFDTRDNFSNLPNCLRHCHHNHAFKVQQELCDRAPSLPLASTDNSLCKYLSYASVNTLCSS